MDNVIGWANWLKENVNKFIASGDRLGPRIENNRDFIFFNIYDEENCRHCNCACRNKIYTRHRE